MRLVTNLVHIVCVHESETRVRCLQVVERLAHVSVGGEDDGLQAIVGLCHPFRFTHINEPLQDVFIRKPAKPNHRAPALYRLDDLGALVASQSEPRRVGVDLHRPSKCLLRSLSHAIRLVKNHNLVPARGQSHFLLGKHLDPIPHNVDSPLVGGVQLEHSLLHERAKKLVRHAQDTRRLSRSRGPREQQIWDVSLFCNDLQSLHGFAVSHHVLDQLWSVLFHPRHLEGSLGAALSLTSNPRTSGDSGN
mmetsp:Transcript_6557/g.11994  ORF Transcript_6557/g.11994 Transcript_6557/m.11994 type:complete len:248 (-) Transcript_6557:162-905(-)